jgi:hypothetical protein
MGELENENTRLHSGLRRIQGSTHASVNKNLKLEIGFFVLLVLQVWGRYS